MVTTNELDNGPVGKSSEENRERTPAMDTTNIILRWEPTLYSYLGITAASYRLKSFPDRSDIIWSNTDLVKVSVMI